MASSSSSATVDRRVSALAPVSEVVERRSHLVTTANPDMRHDYVVSLTAELKIGGLAPAAVSATLQYVPDRHVLRPQSLASYVAAIEDMSWPSLEAVAATVLADLNNELVPRWIHVHLAAAGNGGGVGHDVDIEDRQPSWDNERLIARLDTY